MEELRTTNRPDLILLSFLHSAAGPENENALEELLAAEINPVIEKTLRGKLHASLKPTDFSQNNQDALELFSEVKVLVIAELGKLKANNNGKTIQKLNSYVISVTINAYRQYLRKKYPLREHLKNKLRYLLTHHPRFALWEDDGGRRCGFKSQNRSEKVRPPDADAILAGIAETVSSRNLGERSQLIALLTAVFEFANVPVLLNELLLVVAEIQGIKDQKQTAEFEEQLPRPRNLRDSEDKIISKIEVQAQLAKVWTQICEMPIRHRLALLLNLKDREGDCVVRLLPLLRIASIRQIAAALDFSPVEFAGVWNELPWDDVKIAEYMDLTRQQVINLRQSARARLIRQAG